MQLLPSHWAAEFPATSRAHPFGNGPKGPLGSIPIRPAALQGGPARPLARPSIQRNCADAWGRLCVRSQNQDTKKEQQNARQQESEKQARGRKSGFGGSCLPVFLNVVCGSCRPQNQVPMLKHIGKHGVQHRRKSNPPMDRGCTTDEKTKKTHREDHNKQTMALKRRCLTSGPTLRVVPWGHSSWSFLPLARSFGA